MFDFFCNFFIQVDLINVLFFFMGYLLGCYRMILDNVMYNNLNIIIEYKIYDKNKGMLFLLFLKLV